jgi:hypothetical protein
MEANPDFRANSMSRLALVPAEIDKLANSTSNRTNEMILALRISNLLWLPCGHVLATQMLGSPMEPSCFYSTTI